ncbi:hypothetical protein P7K49_031265 [Saguinus oedipus]|uniref:VWFD domain-containing protein n=1 Tax=Saguinus oedipus TaxID=9490 RepID=A0ABQ9TZQ3_SAGOE|nr:hypothetical protein P7K49_031265 [Saguinus oedipus]
MFGDPHITTLDGVNYTFNGLGDFLLVQAQDGNSSFQLQGRTAQTASAQATNFVAFAAQYRSSSLGPVTVREGCLGPPAFHPQAFHLQPDIEAQEKEEEKEGEAGQEGERSHSTLAAVPESSELRGEPSADSPSWESGLSSWPPFSLLHGGALWVSAPGEGGGSARLEGVWQVCVWDLASLQLPPCVPGPETVSAPGVFLSRSGHEVSASFDGSATVSVTALSSILHASASLPQEYWNLTEGLLGEGGSDLPLWLCGSRRSIPEGFPFPASLEQNPRGTERA